MTHDFHAMRTLYQPVIKRKIFMSYHHAHDQVYYDSFAKIYCSTYDIIYDNSLDRKIDSNNAEYVMRKIREDYLTGSSCTIVLCGSESYKRKYIDWEIKATLDKEHGLIGIILPTVSIIDGKQIIPNRLYDNFTNSYAVITYWNDLAKGLLPLTGWIEQAINKDKKLIINSQDIMQRNLA